ncbi:MAG: translation elongation factor Ts, partial [Clostridia bacterium]
IGEMLTEKIATIGENMNIRRFERNEGICEAYIHGGGRIGVLVNFKLSDPAAASKDAFAEFARDIAMQVAAANPQFIDEKSVPEETVAKEKEILMAQALNEGKPQQIAEKMVNGRIAKFFKEVCLVDQLFIKDTDKTVAALIKEVAGQIGSDIEIVKFTRFEKGEGLAKREEDFANEVASMIK